jgi:streptogramin lyase
MEVLPQAFVALHKPLLQTVLFHYGAILVQMIRGLIQSSYRQFLVINSIQNEYHDSDSSRINSCRKEEARAVMSVAKYIVNRSTTLIQIDSSQNQNAIVLLSSVNTIGSLVTIRDIAGSVLYKGLNDASNNIVTISTMQDIYFLHKDSSDRPVSTILLSQPYGFITVSPKTSTLWAVVNTQAFPDATTAANLINVIVDNAILTEASISTCRISTLAANNISTMSLSAVSSIVQSNLYVPFINNSSLMTSSILTSSLTALSIYVSSIQAISTIIHSNLYVPFINNSSLFTSSILTSTLTAGNIYVSSIEAISTIIHSNVYVPFIYNSSLFTSSILTSSLTALSIYVSSIEAISTIIHSNLYVPFINNSSLFTSSILTSTLTAGNIYVSSIHAISTSILSTVYVPQIQTSSIMASTIIASSITASTVTTSTLSAFTTGVSGSVEISGTNVAPRIWVVVGEASATNPDADILYSTDALTWVAATYDSSVAGVIHVNRVFWNGSNRWVAVGKGTNSILYSDNGMVWKATSGLGFTGTDGEGRGISYNANATTGQAKWVAVGTGTYTILYSDDGITWNSTSGAGFIEGNGITNNGSMWMALGKGPRNILKSTDGITWINLASTNSIPTSESYSDAVYCAETEKWFIVGKSLTLTNTIIYFDNSLTYNSVVSGGFTGGGNSIAWNGCYLVAVGSDSTPAKTIQYSLDGKKWYPSFAGTSANEGSFNTSGYGVTWAENYFIAVGTDLIRPSRTIIYSADGKNWLSNDITGNGQLTLAKGICYSRGSTGPLYALTVKGDAYIDGNLYITNGYPTAVNGLGASGGGASGAAAGGGGSGSSVPVTQIRYLTDVSTMLGQFSSIGVGVKDPAYEIDVAGSINASSNIYINGDKVATENALASSIEGLGSFSYISSLSLQSTVQSFMTNSISLQANFSSIGVNCNSPNYDIDVIGDINYTGTLYRNGLEFTGSASIPGINSIGGIGINKDYEGNAALDVSGQMVVSDYVTLNDGLDVSGNIMVNGLINASRDVSVGGTISALSNVTGNLMVNSNTTLGSYNSVNNLVTTIAGTNVAGYADTSPSIDAKFNLPQGVAVSSDGNIYIADTSNNYIRKVTPQGVVTTLAGGVGVFNKPAAVAVAKDGNIYVADSSNNLIKKVTPQGVVTTFAGGAGVFNNPRGILVAKDGNIYVADSNNNLIKKITPQGVVTTFAGGAGVFNNPIGIAIDDNGNIYVADSGNNSIKKITPSQNVTTIAGNTSAGWVDATPWIDSRFDSPIGVAVSKDGNIYVTDYNNRRIRLLKSSNQVITLAGNGGATLFADGVGVTASFLSPVGIAISPDGNIYVADAANNCIRKINSGTSSLNMTGNAYFTNFITAGGNLNTNGDLDVGGNAYFRGGLYTTSLNLTNLSASGTLNGANLAVSGTSVLTGAVTTGAVNAASVTATGAVNSVTLNVSDAATFYVLTASGITINGGLTAGPTTLGALTASGVSLVANNVYSTASTAAAPPTTRGLGGSISYVVSVPNGNQQDIGLGPIINSAGTSGPRVFLVSCVAQGSPGATATMMVSTSGGPYSPQQSFKYAAGGLDWDSSAAGTSGNWNMLLNNGIGWTINVNVTVTFLI